MRRGAGVLRLVLAFALLMAALSLVIWRQGRTREVLRALDHTRDERAEAESQRAELLARIQRLESRPRVVTDAAARLGMRVPSGDEITILPHVGARSAP